MQLDMDIGCLLEELFDTSLQKAKTLKKLCMSVKQSVNIFIFACL